GKQIETVGATAYYSSPRISPDGKRIAVLRRETHTEAGDIWLYDMERRNMSRLTFSTEAFGTVTWSSDSRRVLFGSANDIFAKDWSGASNEESLYHSDLANTPEGISPDGKFLAFVVDSFKTQQDLWILPLSGERKPFPLLQTRSNEYDSAFSPDGRWIAYS